jgi:dipeptidyl aminopeptidase/acylaminoacyl peptidase
MNRLCVRISLLAFVFPLSSNVQAQTAAKRAIRFDDMMKIHRLGAEVSRDGKRVVYVVSTPDMEANRNAGNIWMVSTAGGEPLQLTQSGKDSSPSWSPDNKTLAFLSSRDGTSQVYLLSMDPPLFVATKKYPMLVLLHGGPQTMWSNPGATAGTRRYSPLAGM